MTEEPVALSPAPGPGRGEEKRAILPAVAGGLLFVAAILGGLFWFTLRQRPQASLPPSQEDIAYAAKLDLTDLHLTAEENFLGQTVVYLDGKLANRGDKILRGLSLRLYFRDYMNQVVLREDRVVLDTKVVPIAPGQAREFQLRFDRLPDSWNRQVPQFQLVSIQIQ